MAGKNHSSTKRAKKNERLKSGYNNTTRLQEKKRELNGKKTRKIGKICTGKMQTMFLLVKLLVVRCCYCTRCFFSVSDVECVL